MKETAMKTNSTEEKEPRPVLPVIEPHTDKSTHLDTTNNTPTNLDTIISVFPPRARPCVRLVYAYFHSPNTNNVISSTNKGEMVIGEKKYFGSSLTDLLYDTTCRKRSYTPLYAQQFYQALRNNNAPPGLILNAERRKLMHIDGGQPNVKKELVKKWLPY